MGERLKLFRDLTVIVGIYLYFIAWVYVHFYYRQFGISTESIKIDYSSYLVYSYNVLVSYKFLYWVVVFLALLLLRMILLFVVKTLEGRSLFITKLQGFLSGNIVSRYFRSRNQQYSLLLLIIFLVIIFPLLFKIAREVAIDHYRDDRAHTENLKTIQFIFKKNVDILSPTIVLDSVLPRGHIFYDDIALIKNDRDQLLKLLGESDKYYIVLQQRPFNKVVGALPTGYIYFIDKNDIQLTKIILRSL